MSAATIDIIPNAAKVTVAFCCAIDPGPLFITEINSEITPTMIAMII